MNSPLLLPAFLRTHILDHLSSSDQQKQGWIKERRAFLFINEESVNCLMAAKELKIIFKAKQANLSYCCSWNAVFAMRRDNKEHLFTSNCRQCSACCDYFSSDGGELFSPLLLTQINRMTVWVGLPLHTIPQWNFNCIVAFKLLNRNRAEKQRHNGPRV